MKSYNVSTVRWICSLLLLAFLSPAYAGLKKNIQEELCVKISYIPKGFFPKKELAYIFQRVHKVLFNHLNVRIFFIDLNTECMTLTKGEKNDESNSYLVLKNTHNANLPEIRIKSKELNHSDYHDFLLIVWLIQEYSSEESLGLSHSKIKYITEEETLKRLYTLVLNDLNIGAILKSNDDIAATYRKAREIHNFGNTRVAKPDGTKFPDFKILKAGGKEYLMIFGSIEGYRAEYISFRKDMPIEKSRKLWVKKALTEEEYKKYDEREEGYLFEEYYFPHSYVLKVPFPSIYDPDMRWNN